MAPVIARRGVLGAGALGGLAVGLLSQARAEPAARPVPAAVAGILGCHVRLDPMRGAKVRLTELDAASRPVRDLAVTTIPVAALYPDGVPRAGAAPLPVACRLAQRLAQQIAAANWQVQPETCRMEGHDITHPATGRTIRLRTWVDVI